MRRTPSWKSTEGKKKSAGRLRAATEVFLTLANCARLPHAGGGRPGAGRRRVAVGLGAARPRDDAQEEAQLRRRRRISAVSVATQLILEQM
jgi:hypothetical protein